MKNKLLKSLTCFASVFAIGSTIAIASTSCGSSSEEKIYALPEDVYQIDANGVLQGFKSGVDLSQYDDGKCDTLLIPTSVTSIKDFAFVNTYATATTIPQFITKLIFPKKSNCSSISGWAFGKCSSLTFVDLLNCSKITTIDDNAFSSCSLLPSITFPSSLETIGNSAFWNCSSLKYIAWDLPDEYETKIKVDNAAFSQISSTGTVKSLNLSIASSQQLFDWIKTKGSFPSAGWGPAD